ncbi:MULTISPECIES: taurine ABC transporter substrate-binding protein [unclassified Shinella]|jgi:taurine transport system substrate-binding protein|uniref:taurine ABC transporter substrate-binding protein n=1 Tax=unclassified Shinella TaxID=2643062 RepID=UPI00102D3C57|nr:MULTISPECIES: taurine ABC transporter substrate-binding protein [unclassified Shinella]MCO5151172.1 taurine ABC transporter substrate-binding protein [Shinella sp.]MDC7266021.1 taurine ABC transporter substrate-binding protein [Shinella sp. HY16]MDC7272918.1 taurine ABC transporter substrate-binding protein [Shinella sp. YZ44]TAA63939.1 taurine ABC transporter substrate-binding protein [Shinella sp. JR1-6]
MTTTRRTLLAATAALALTASFGTAFAEEVTLNIGYQPIVEPSRVPQADGTYEKVTGAKINWQKFDGGADVIAAIASGSLDIGYVGSSPLAAASSRELPIETIFVVGLISEAEALAVKSIEKPEALAGKKIATPFVSTAHYSLLTALKHWKVDPKSVEILNLRPPEIAAAWERGDIDGAYVWDPVLAQLKKSGKVLATSADVAEWGGPTFDAWIVSKKFAEEHPDVVTAFVKVTGDATAAYRANPESWNATSPEAEKIARLTGAKQDEVPALLKGYIFPTLEEQAGEALLGGGTVKAVADTSAFLLEQGKIPAALSDYAPYVSTRWVTDATKLAY